MTSSRQKRKTSERFQPAKSDQIFVEAGEVKRQPAKCRQCRLCGERCLSWPLSRALFTNFKLKSRDGVFWMEVYQRLSEFAHTQTEKVWSRIILVHNNFFLSYSMFACAMYWFFVITFFFNFRIIILVDRKCWLSGHNHLYVTQGHIIIYFL